MEFFHKTIGTSLRVDNLVNRHAIDPRSTLVGTHLFPGCLQHVSPIDTIIQNVKSKLRLSLGLLVKLLSQRREFWWKGTTFFPIR
jgi:hypothetical protein